MSDCECAYCGELFSSTHAYDRHLLVRRMTVTSPKGYEVPNEEVVTCRPVAEFSKLINDGKPRLVRNARKRWSTPPMTAEALAAIRSGTGRESSPQS